MQTNEQIIEKANELLQGKMKALSVNSVNSTPHPYCLGPRHIAYAQGHFSGMLSEEAIKAAENNGIHCAQPGCHVAFEDHKSDKVLFLQLTQHLTNSEANTLLKSLVDTVLNPNSIDGVSFVETPEKYRMNKEEV